MTDIAMTLLLANYAGRLFARSLISMIGRYQRHSWPGAKKKLARLVTSSPSLSPFPSRAAFGLLCIFQRQLNFD